MGTLTLIVKKDVDEPISYAVTVMDMDIDRLAAAYAATYFPNGIEVTPATDPKTYRAPTSAEVVAAISQGLANGMMANVVSFEREQAAKAAAEAVTAPVLKPL